MNKIKISSTCYVVVLIIAIMCNCISVEKQQAILNHEFGDGFVIKPMKSFKIEDKYSNAHVKYVAINCSTVLIINIDAINGEFWITHKIPIECEE